MAYGNVQPSFTPKKRRLLKRLVSIRGSYIITAPWMGTPTRRRSVRWSCAVITRWLSSWQHDVPYVVVVSRPSGNGLGGGDAASFRTARKSRSNGRWHQLFSRKVRSESPWIADRGCSVGDCLRFVPKRNLTYERTTCRPAPCDIKTDISRP